MSAAEAIRYEPFWDDRLHRCENKAVELALNGFSLEEVADEMDVSPNSAKQYVSRARRIGIRVPRFRPKSWAKVPIARLVHIRRMLQANGIAYGLYPLIAERVGMTTVCVRKRLWEYDQKQKRARA